MLDGAAIAQGHFRTARSIDLIDRTEELKASMKSRAEHLTDAIVPFSFLRALGLFTRNLTKALSALMVDYSCAIKLSTSICVISATREASGRRIMVKGGKYLEAFVKADTIIFGKTGTLTAACPNVSKVLSFGGYPEDEVLKISACINEHQRLPGVGGRRRIGGDEGRAWVSPTRWRERRTC